MTQPQPPTDEQLAAYIGPKWEKVYRRKFERFRSDPRGRFRPSWNWAAALYPPWFIENRLYATFAALFACVLVLANLAPGDSSVSTTAWIYVVAYPFALVYLPLNAVQAPGVESIALAAAAVALTVVQGLMANWLLYRKALAAAATIVPPVPPVARAGWLSRRRSPPRINRSGSGVMGVALLLGIPLFACGCDFGNSGEHREGRYAAAMNSSLRNLVTAEESYFASQGTYTVDQRNILAVWAKDSSNFPRGSWLSAGVTVTIGTATDTGWSATAKLSGTTKTCGIYVGSASAPIAGQGEGEPKCPP